MRRLNEDAPRTFFLACVPCTSTKVYSRSSSKRQIEKPYLFVAKHIKISLKQRRGKEKNDAIVAPTAEKQDRSWEEMKHRQRHQLKLISWMTGDGADGE